MVTMQAHKDNSSNITIYSYKDKEFEDSWTL